MAVDASTLSDYNGQQVILQRITDEGLEELIGKAETANETGVLLRPKGRGGAIELIEADEIEEIDLAPTDNKLPARSKLKTVPLGRARKHLLDRHGLTRSEAKNMSEKEAFDRHNKAHADDEKAKELGHYHSDDDSDAAEASEE